MRIKNPAAAAASSAAAASTVSNKSDKLFVDYFARNPNENNHECLTLVRKILAPYLGRYYFSF